MDQLEIAVSYGEGRKSKKWNTDIVDWDKFVKKLSKFDVKKETVAEYKAMTKTAQSDLKDGKAFVGGFVKGDSRKKGNIESRSMLTLDADSISSLDDFLFEVEMNLGDTEYVIYSTLSHSAKGARLRLIVPLSEEVEADKHEAIARKIASNIDMESFDRTTFDVNRLMYLPARLADAEHIFIHNEGEPLDVDEVLAEYFDWTNWGEWPRHADEDEKLLRARKKAGDPLSKPGRIGIFNRTYSISDAIETFLSDRYEKCDDADDRYTYIGGTTAGGLVLYDNDTFCHSHHSTDPISGQMVNAYDLVRIHLYDHLDDAAAGKLIAGKRPSDKMMNMKVDKDKQCTVTVINEQEAERMADFADEDFDDYEETPTEDMASDSEDPDAWKEKLAKEGEEILPTTQNFSLLIDNGRFKGRFAFNEFTSSFDILKPVPWRKKEEWNGGKRVKVTDFDKIELRTWIEKVYDLRRKDMLDDAFVHVARKNSYHPIKEYIEQVEWDGVPRAETIFIDMVGAEDSNYVRQVTRKTLIAAVKRLYEPGSKFDYMPVLVGGQGIGKSTILEKLAVRPEWFNGSLDDFDGKKAGEHLQAGWIFELGELAAMGKSGIEDVKRFLTLTSDKYRAAYAETVQEYPRKNVFFGTTNRMDFLFDKTGNRRFMPIKVNKMPEGKAHWDTIPMNNKGDAGFDYIHQLWAEVYTWYMAGEGVFLDSKTTKEAEEMQKAHTSVDDFEEQLIEWLDTPEEADDFEIGESITRTEVTAQMIYKQVMNGDEPVVPTPIGKRIKLLMDNMEGWEKATIRVDGKQKRGYRRV
ncbi:nucleoside triphosphate hyrolase [Bacillus phage vB_BceS_LY1]|uniref:Nucleoside triphosphate hyrolase n=1 Tax=Bacillus phage vB_BceS_LY1 TaxID=2950459 RepID=A0AAE9S1P2_9CAUD|nr:nucleoside triphosphate hyrolase [Bacillus phage vB_BceS_LY1]